MSEDHKLDGAFKNRTDVSVMLVLFFALAIIGIVAGGFFVRDYARARASAAWIPIDAVVLSEVKRTGGGLRYAYSIDGHTYESGRERVFTAGFLRGKTKDLSPGDDLIVYVNPGNHAYAVLYPGGASAAFLAFFVVSGLCVFFGGGGIVWVLSQGAENELNPEANGMLHVNVD